MPLKAPRTRASVGEQRPPGDVRPVTTRTLVGLSAGLAVVVVLAITAVIVASGSPKTSVNTQNVPTSLGSGSTQTVTSSATYRETVQLPSGSNRDQVVPAELSLQCAGLCRGGTLNGYLGTFTLTTVFGATTTLTGTLNGSCETITLTPQASLNGTPQILTGTITRPTSCTNTTSAAPTPITIRLDRT